MELDIYDLCSENLQKKLCPVREKMKIEEDKRVEKIKVNLLIALYCSANLFAYFSHNPDIRAVIRRIKITLEKNHLALMTVCKIAFLFFFHQLL